MGEDQVVIAASTPEICPITQCPMLEPAKTTCGHSFEYAGLKTNIEQYGETTCPLCRKDLLDLATHKITLQVGLEVTPQWRPTVLFSLKPKLNKELVNKIYVNSLYAATEMLLELRDDSKLNSQADQYFSKSLRIGMFCLSQSVANLPIMQAHYVSVLNFHKSKMSA